MRRSKRNLDDFELDWSTSNVEPATKRHVLPFRTSPEQPERPGLGPRRPAYMSFNRQTPTPAESSEDEVDETADTEMDQATDENLDPRSTGADSEISLQAQASDTNQEHNNDQMELGSPPAPRHHPLPPPISISHYDRSDLAIASPASLPSPHPRAFSDRIPTPIHATFPHHTYHNRLPVLRSTLSPALGGDTPPTAHPLNRLPSPASPSDQQMDMSTSSDQLSNGLNIGGVDAQMTSGGSVEEEGGQALTPTISRPTSSFQGQKFASPRLRMGYRSNCEKCRLKVQGHYNHVLWT